MVRIWILQMQRRNGDTDRAGSDLLYVGVLDEKSVSQGSLKRMI